MTLETNSISTVDQAKAACLSLCRVSKHFGGVQALREVSLDLWPGQIHALVGENGAGKSTLINIATGVLHADAGELRLAGQSVRLANSRAAAEAGVVAVFQEADDFPHLSVAENMLLGQGLVRRRTGLIHWPATYRLAERQVADMGEAIDVRERAGSLRIGHRVLTQIAAAVASRPRVLFLDEPTASLTARETERLFGQLQVLKGQGVAIVFVSHRLEEVLRHCDMVTVLRDGAHVVTGPREDFDENRLVAAMVGRESHAFYTHQPAPRGEVGLELKNLSSAEGTFRNVSFSVARGEIVGIYGLVGAGRTELAQAAFGLTRHSGEIYIQGKKVTIRRPAQAVAAGLAYLPEDRLSDAIFAGHSCRANASAAELRRLDLWGWLRERRERALTRQVIDAFSVKLASTEQPIASLSGGNQQKIIFGRWWATRPGVLLLDEPTRGVDVGAKGQIYQAIDAMAAEGKAIVLISSDLPEVLRMSDRVLVMAEGEIRGCFDPATATADQVAAAAIPGSQSQKLSGTAGHPEPAPVRRRLPRIREAGIALALILFAGLMAAARPAEFATLQNLMDVLTAAAILSVGAAGMTLVIASGGIDISVGAILGLAGAAGGMLAVRGLPPPLCLLAAVAAGSLACCVNAGLSNLGRIHPIVITLAGISIYRGLMLKMTGGYEVSPLPDAYRAMTDGLLLGAPKVVWIAVAALAVNWLLISHTLLGRRILAVGNSLKASRLIGLSPANQRLLAFLVLGVALGVASVMWGGYYGKIQSNTGVGWEMKIIAAAVIGGCSILGGRGTALGAFLGAILIALINNALVILKVSAYWQDAFIGALILIVVALDLALPRLTGIWNRRGRSAA